MRTLIVAPETIGLALKTQPVLAQLRRLDPRGTLHVLVPRHLVPVFECMAEVDSILINELKHARHKMASALSLGCQVLRLRVERAWVLAQNQPLPWLTRLTGLSIQRCTPEAALAQLSRVSQAAPAPARALQRRASDPCQAGPVISLRRHPQREAQARERAGLAPHAPLLALALGPAADGQGGWPKRHWASVLIHLRRSWPDLQPVLLGEASERHAATEIATLAGGQLPVLCGSLDLAQGLALLAQAEAIIAPRGDWAEAAHAFGRTVFPAIDPPEVVWARVYRHLERRASRNLR